MNNDYNIHLLDIQSDDVDNHFTITLYGKNENNENVVCHIDDFKPYFYVKIPEDWSNNDFEVHIIQKLKDIYWKKIENKKDPNYGNETNEIDNIKYFNRKYFKCFTRQS